ncbi:MAG: hypothetical protein IT438_15670 [Phycisphaerales bacterium]|nr:hypothetical protein [Phycisphaerales bacterium]
MLKPLAILLLVLAAAWPAPMLRPVAGGECASRCGGEECCCCCGTDSDEAGGEACCCGGAPEGPARDDDRAPAPRSSDRGLGDWLNLAGFCPLSLPPCASSHVDLGVPDERAPFPRPALQRRAMLCIWRT